MGRNSLLGPAHRSPIPSGTSRPGSRAFRRKSTTSPSHPRCYEDGLQRFLTICLFVSMLCLPICVIGTWHWPLISDAVLMHYVVFLMHHGMAVYRDIIDVNMPGSYLVDDGIVHVFGSGEIAWRACDFTILVIAGAAMVALAWPYSRPGGLVAANTFAVLHCADGVAQAGQRDFQVAVLLLAGAACLLCAFRQPQFKRRLLGILVWGLCAGTAATIKPQFLIVGILVILVTSVACGRSLRSWIKPAAIGAAARAAPALLAALFVLRQNAIDSFFSQAVPLTIYHATMGRHSLAFLLGHAIPTKLLPIILVGLAGAWWRSPWSRSRCWSLASARRSASYHSFSRVRRTTIIAPL
jgi:hypothetical protein